MRPDVLVVGGGCAGLSAATALAEKGAKVCILEARSVPGGRSYSWTDPLTGHVEDNGQHLLMACYEEFLSFVRRTGGISELQFQDRLEVILLEPGGREAAFRPGLLPRPLDLLWGLLKLRGFPLRDVWSSSGIFRGILNNGAGCGGMTVEEWLTSLGQSEEGQRLFWTPLALATLNLHPSVAAATLLREVLRRALLQGPEAARLGFPRRGLNALVVDPAVRYVWEHGGSLLTRCPVVGLELDGRGRFASARLKDGTRHGAGSAILAVPHREAARLLPTGATSFGTEEATLLSESPIVAVHLWLDRSVSDHAMAGLLDSSIHWVFDRARMGGAPPPGYLALVTSAACGLASADRESLVHRSLQELGRFFPRARGARLLRSRVVKERQATPRFGPGTVALRPGSQTEVPNLALAGDWTDTGLPATLEGASTSGHRAAALVAGTFPLG